jgi:signal transduction histidine kinase
VARRTRLERVYTWVRANPFQVDVLLAVSGVLLLVLIPAQTYGFSSSSMLIGIAILVPIGWRRRFPVPSAAAVTAVGLVQIVAGVRIVPADVGAVLLATYALAGYAPQVAARVGLAVAVVTTAVAIYRQEAPFEARGALLSLDGFATTLVMVAWALGTLRRLRRQEDEALLERTRLLELERDQEARLGAAAERARIAREMHDVVAHSLSVTISQADGGRYAARSDPQAAVTALETISVTGRQALADMRALLGVLRQDEGRELAPQPDTDAIPELIDQVAASGLQISYEAVEPGPAEGGRPGRLQPGTALAAYRIVQESLTNVLKHAGPQAVAWVRLRWLPDYLEVWVVDDGRGAGAALNRPGDTDSLSAGGSGGQGLRGMRERAALHGGRLEAGPRSGGGFSVRAELPYERS